MSCAWQCADNLFQIAYAVEILAGIPIAVGRKNQLGLNLAEPVDHGLGAKFGRGRRPDGADGRCREHRNHGLGNVGHVGDHPVAFAKPERTHPGRQFANGAGDLAPTHGGQRAQFRAVAKHVPVRIAGKFVTKDMFGVVEPGSREPSRARHGVIRDDRLKLAFRRNLEIIPDGRPEAFRSATDHCQRSS